MFEHAVRYWGSREKIRLVKRAMRGDNIFPILEQHNITWWEFREWWKAYKLDGTRGLQIKYRNMRRNKIAKRKRAV